MTRPRRCEARERSDDTEVQAFSNTLNTPPPLPSDPDLFFFFPFFFPTMHSYVKMADTGLGNISQSFRGRRLPFRLIFSYIFDWVICLAFAGLGGVFDRLSPAKRPFSLVDPNIS